MNRRTNPFRHDRTVGHNLVPTIPLTSLQVGLQNMRVAQHSIGTDKWLDRLGRTLWDNQYGELDNLSWEGSRPCFAIQERGESLQKLQSVVRNNPDQMNEYLSKLPGREHRALLKMLQQDHSDVYFLTVICTVKRADESALCSFKREARKLERVIRNRFDNAFCIMFPEADLVRAGDITASLLPVPRWKDAFQSNQQVFKLHYHGIICAKGLDRKRVEQLIQTTPTGRRSKSYSGSNQVRALPIDYVETEDGKKPDVFGVAGYANKCHYRPACKQRPFEGYPIWARLMDQIGNTPSLTIIVGTNGKYRKSTGAEAKPDHPRDFSPDAVMMSSSGSSYVVQYGHTREYFIHEEKVISLVDQARLALNCKPVSGCGNKTISTMVKRTPDKTKINNLAGIPRNIDHRPPVP